MSVLNNNSVKLAKAAATQAAIEAFLNNGGSIAQGYVKPTVRKQHDGITFHFSTSVINKNLAEQVAQLAPNDWESRLNMLANIAA